MDVSKMDPVFRSVPARAAGDNEVIAGLERLGRKTGLFETAGIGPFGGKHLPRPILVHDRQVKPRVRILELEGGDIAFESDLLFLEIVSSK